MGRGRITVTPGFLFLMAWCNYADQQGLLLPALAGARSTSWATWRPSGGWRIGAAPAADSCGGGDPDGAAHVLSGGAGQRRWRARGQPGGGLAVLPAEGGALFAGLNLALGCFNLLPVGRLDGGRALHCLLSMSIGPAAEEAEAVLDRVLIAFLLALGVLLIGWGGSFTLLLVALWLLAKEKEGKKGRNRSCQGLQKRVKWFLHSK